VFGVQVGLVVLVSILFCFKSLDITNFPTRTHLGTETDQLLQMVITGVFKDGIIITVAHRLDDFFFCYWDYCAKYERVDWLWDAGTIDREAVQV
jgi:hypothetical protein